MTRFYRMLIVPTFALLIFVLAGCTSSRLPDGRYSAGFGDDCVVVRNDLIFLHISTPQNNPSQLAFWDWAGPYSLTKEGRLSMDMDREQQKLWDFYYSFLYKENAIQVIDKGEDRPVLTLVLEAPARR